MTNNLLMAYASANRQHQGHRFPDQCIREAHLPLQSQLNLQVLNSQAFLTFFFVSPDIGQRFYKNSKFLLAPCADVADNSVAVQSGPTSLVQPFKFSW